MKRRVCVRKMGELAHLPVAWCVLSSAGVRYRCGSDTLT